MNQRIRMVTFALTLALSTGLVPSIASAQSAGVIPFTDPSWRFIGQNNPGYPVINGSELQMIPDDRGSAAQAAILMADFHPPFAVEFEYSTFDDDGGSPWSSADGVVMMFGRDEASYFGQAPPNGHHRAFIADGNGYGVHFHTYGPDRRILLTDGDRTTLAGVPNDGVYTHGQYRRVRVEVRSDGVQVFLDGQLQLSWRGAVASQYGRIGFGAATGAADSDHRVRNVRVLSLAPRPTLIINGGFESPRIPDRSWRPLEQIEGWRRSSGPVIEVQASVAGSPAQGRQLVELDSHGSTAIYQDVQTRPLALYELSYAVAARPGMGVEDNRIAVSVDGQVIDTAEVSGEQLSDTQWQRRRVRFQASGPLTRLEFRDLGISNGYGTFLDDVSLVEVPSSSGELDRAEIVLE